MSYIYDVFISYKRGGTKDVWVEKIFAPLFTEYLGDEILRPPTIFVDKTGLTKGADWSDEIIYALAHSKCLVAIVSPVYFMNSEWCIKEFLTIQFRQQKLNLRAGSKPPSLMWLVAVQEFTNVPPIIHTIQLSDYKDYNLVGDAFFRSDEYLKFQKVLRADVKTVGNIIKNRPEWQAEWETEIWMNDIKKVTEQYYQDNKEIKQNFLTW